MPERVSFVGDPAHPSRLIEDPGSADDNPTIAFFLNYWRSKREKVLPLRDTFAPKEVRGHLQWVLTVDAMPQFEDFRYRVIGSRITDYFLGDATGKTIREAFSAIPELGERLIQLFRLCALERRPLRFTGPSSRYAEIFYPGYDCLYLPYSSDGVTTDRLVCIFTFDRKALFNRSPAEMGNHSPRL